MSNPPDPPLKSEDNSGSKGSLSENESSEGPCRDLFTLYQNDQPHFNNLFKLFDNNTDFDLSLGKAASRKEPSGLWGIPAPLWAASPSAESEAAYGPQNLPSPETSFSKRENVEVMHAGTPGGKRNRETTRLREKRAKKSRDARLRKKLYVQQLEEEIETLTREIEVKKKSLLNSKESRSVFNGKNEMVVKKDGWDGSGKEEKSKQEKARERTELGVDRAKLTAIELRVNGHQKTVYMEKGKIERLCSKFISNPAECLNQATYYLDCVDECLLPGAQVKFLLWVVNQKKEFYEKEVPQKLLKGINIPFEKIKAALGNRKLFKSDKPKIDDLIRRIFELQGEIKSHLVGVSDLANKIRSRLSPLQMVRFFIWSKTEECQELMQEIKKDALFANPIGK